MIYIANLCISFPSEGRGHRFESCRVRQTSNTYKTALPSVRIEYGKKGVPARCHLAWLSRALGYIVLLECRVLKGQGVAKASIRQAAFVLALSIPSICLAQAKIDFAAYEGPPQIIQGTGGTKITKNGIDYWTTGTPSRRYLGSGLIRATR